MDAVHDSGESREKGLAFFGFYGTMFSHFPRQRDKSALQTALLFICEVIIPHPQIPQEFVGGFIRRSSAPAEPDDDKRNATLKCLHFSGRSYAANGFL